MAAGAARGPRGKHQYGPGDRVGDWTVLAVERAEEGGGRTGWHYRCQCEECWAEHVVWKGNLERGKTSCCVACASRLANERGRALYGRIGLRAEDVERLSNRFYAMRSRCVGGSRPHPAYAGRGIRCEFGSPEEFIRYAVTVDGWDDKNNHVDRIESDGHYAPGNIRFGACAANQRNKRTNLRIDYKGASYVAEDFHRLFCPDYRDASTVARKIREGETADQIIAGQAGCRGAYIRHR